MQPFTPRKLLNARENQSQKKGDEKGEFHPASAQRANKEEECEDGPGHQESAHIGIGYLWREEEEAKKEEENR